MALEISSLNRPDFSGIEQLNADAVQGNVRAGAAERPQGAAALPGPDQARLRAAPQVAARQASLAGRIKTGFQNFCADVKALFKPSATRGLPKELSLDVSVLGQNRKVKLPSKAFAGMINSLSPRLRQDAAANLQKTLQDRICRGEDLLKAILKDQPLAKANPTEQDIADIMLLLQVKAHAVGEGFERGSFSIEDQDGRLAQYFERCDGMYLRSSSHLEKQQGETVDGHRNAHRGVDFSGGPKQGLLFGLKTVLFATIPELKDGNDVKAGRRLFLKPETYGCRLSTRSLCATFKPAKYAADYGEKKTQRPINSSDFPSALGHGASYIKTKIQTKILPFLSRYVALRTGIYVNLAGPEGRREKLPKEFVPLLNEIAKQSPEVARKLGIVKDSKDPLKGAGIRSFFAKLDTLNPEERTEDVQNLVNEIKKKWPNSTNNERMGDEVMLDYGQLM